MIRDIPYWERAYLKLFSPAKMRNYLRILISEYTPSCRDLSHPSNPSGHRRSGEWINRKFCFPRKKVSNWGKYFFYWTRVRSEGPSPSWLTPQFSLRRDSPHKDLNLPASQWMHILLPHSTIHKYTPIGTLSSGARKNKWDYLPEEGIRMTAEDIRLGSPA